MQSIIAVTATGSVLPTADLFGAPGTDWARYDQSGLWVPAHEREVGALAVTVRDAPESRDPITSDGWYEHTDGTVGKYTWRENFGGRHGNRVWLDKIVPNWAEVA